MPATVLVTGAAGFVGSTLVDRLLAEGRRVVGVDDLSGGSLASLATARADHPGAFEFHRLDVRSDGLGAIVRRHRPSTILHLASRAGAEHGWDDPVRTVEADVVGTLRVLEAAAAGDVDKVVLASDRLVPGAVAASPRSVAARAAEAAVAAWGARHGLRWTVVGLPNVYGPRGELAARPGVVATFLRQLAAGEPSTLHGGGEQARDLLHVDDAVDALARAVAAGDGRRVDVGSGTATSIAALHAALRAATGSPTLPVEGPSRPGDASHPPVDPAPAAEALGWRPFTPLDEGLAATVRGRRDRRRG